MLVPNFYDNEKDRELIKIIPFLKHLSELKEIVNVEEHKADYENQIIHILEEKRKKEESY